MFDGSQILSIAVFSSTKLSFCLHTLILNTNYFLGLASILDDDRDYVGSSNLGSGSGQADHQVPSSNQGSRFSQFFQRPQPQQQQQQPEVKLDERRSSIQVIKNFLHSSEAPKSESPKSELSRNTNFPAFGFCMFQYSNRMQFLTELAYCFENLES